MRRRITVAILGRGHRDPGPHRGRQPPPGAAGRHLHRGERAHHRGRGHRRAHVVASRCSPDATSSQVLRRVGAFDHSTLVGLGPTGSLAGRARPARGPAPGRRRPCGPGRPWRATSGTSSSWPSRSTSRRAQRQALDDGLPASDVPRPGGHPPRGQPRQRRRLLRPRGRGRAPGRRRGGRACSPGASAHPSCGRSAPRARSPAGNLEATVPVDQREYPELAELAEAINTLGENLGRAQGLEREFLLSVSHELRTPLTSIRGYADAIADGATDDVPGAVAIIGGEARRLERLVQDLLDLARLQARQFSLHTQRVDCAAVARTVAEGFQPEADEPGSRARYAPRRPAAAVGRRRSRPGGSGRRQPHRERAQVRRPPGSRSARQRVGEWVAVWVADDGPGVERRRPPPHLRAPLHLGPRAGPQARSRAGPGHRGRTGLGHGRRRSTPSRRSTTGAAPAWCCGCSAARRPTGTTDPLDAPRTVDADAGAPPPPPCVGGAPSASAPVAALRLPTVEPQPRRPSGLGIRRLRAGRLGPHAAVHHRARLGQLSSTVPGPARRAGAMRSTRRSRLRGRSTRARTTEPRYRTMKPITATSHRCGPGPVEASDDGAVAGPRWWAWRSARRWSAWRPRWWAWRPHRPWPWR